MVFKNIYFDKDIRHNLKQKVTLHMGRPDNYRISSTELLYYTEAFKLLERKIFTLLSNQHQKSHYLV